MKSMVGKRMIPHECTDFIANGKDDIAAITIRMFEARDR